MLAASGTPAVAPIVELRKRGYKGAIYSGQAIANADFLRVGGAQIDGLRVAVGPIVAAEQLPQSNPIKAPALAYAKAYEGKYGPTRGRCSVPWPGMRVACSSAAASRR